MTPAPSPGMDRTGGPVLAFSTSGPFCGAALLIAGQPDLIRVEDMARGQVERLIPLLEETLTDAGVEWRDLAALGVGTGPGNFTGIRIAVATARGLALGLKVPAVGVSGFEALAHDQPRPVAALIAAPRGRLYAQRFDPGGAQPPRIAAPEDLTDLADVPLVGEAQALGRAPLSPALPEIAAIAHIARGRVAQGGTVPRPAPGYIAGPAAAPPSDPPPRIIP